jgi:predicted cupin superfamily sugar epimerase
MALSPGWALLVDIGSEQHGAATQILGSDVAAGEQPQIAVPPGYWQRAQPRDNEPSLVSCIVVPGFDFDDFVLDASAGL